MMSSSLRSEKMRNCKLVRIARSYFGSNQGQSDPADFLIIGAQKAGTTALYNYLKLHPKICMPSPKEAHFFDNEVSVSWEEPNYESYNARFCNCSHGSLKGEATPSYLFWPNSLERIRRYNPAIKLIVLLRDPVARAYSHWSMEVARGAEKLGFSSAIRQGRARMADFQSSPRREHRVVSYVERGFYADQILRLLDLFPRDQIHFIEMSELWDKHKMLLAEVCDFLKIVPYSTVPTRKAMRPIDIAQETEPNLGHIKIEDIAYLRKLYQDDIASTSSLTGLDLTGWT